MAVRMMMLKLFTFLGVVATNVSGTLLFQSDIPSSAHLQEEKSCFPAVFSFGSSVADTGTDVLIRTNSNADNLPYGMTYFNTSSKRWSDGRLLIDFWAEALRLPFLHPSIKVVGSSFLQGANFAAAGATAVNSTSPLNSPFHLAVQLHQFRKFRRAVLLENEEGTNEQICNLPFPPRSFFGDALYVIAVGGNDIMGWFSDKLQLEEMQKRIPELSAAILHVVQGLYEEGARNILVEDVYPVGCLAKVLAVHVPSYGEQARVDSSGCSEFFNHVAKIHHLFLKHEIEALARKLPDLSVAFVDTYTTRYDMMTNPGKYGFTDGIRVCCGIGGENNFDPKRSCASSYSENGKLIQVQACVNVSGHVVWDGVHYTEAANRILMKAILSEKHFYPRFQIMRDSCSLVEF